MDRGHPYVVLKQHHYHYISMLLSHHQAFNFNPTHNVHALGLTVVVTTFAFTFHLHAALLKLVRADREVREDDALQTSDNTTLPAVVSTIELDWTTRNQGDTCRFCCH